MNGRLRRQLIQRAIAAMDRHCLPIATIDEFFEGNTDEQSIGVNLMPDHHIGLAGFRRVLSEVEAKREVQAVLIELHEIPEPDDPEDEGMWPVGWVAFVVTLAPVEEVRRWVAPLRPRDVCEGWNIADGVTPPIPASELHHVMRPVRVWLG
jgi:hypothetical protein